jgi:hypothetical protein
MGELVRAEKPFCFATRLNLTELTGLRASTLAGLVELIKEVPGSCIYHHTHRFLQQHQYLSPEPPNDFAYWVAETLGEDELGERLASIDTVEFAAIRGLRGKIVETIEAYMSENPRAGSKYAGQGSEFHFMKSMSFIFPTNYCAYDLAEFAAALEKVTMDSIYFHVFEARLRLEKQDNDFSFWIANALGNTGLAKKISKLDPYTYTLEELKNTLLKMIRKYT